MWNKSHLQPCQRGGFGARCLPTQRDHCLWEMIGSEDFVREKMARRVGRRAQNVGHNPRGARPPVHLATLVAERQPGVRIRASAQRLPASQPSMLAPTTKAFSKCCRRLDLHERGEHDQARQVASLLLRRSRTNMFVKTIGIVIFHEIKNTKMSNNWLVA